MGVRVGAEQMAKAVEIRLRHIRRALEPRPDAVATLARLKNQDYKVGLLSNCSIEIPILWPETTFADLVESPIFSSRERVKKSVLNCIKKLETGRAPPSLVWLRYCNWLDAK